MSGTHFKTQLFAIGSWTILRLPESVSAKLPSRGLTMVEGKINGFHFQAALEPDGKGSHWFRIEESMLKTIHAKIGDSVSLDISTTKDWVEPVMPTDLKKALTSDKTAQNVWKEITPMARWEWIRWIRSTKQAKTRKHRIEVACSKLNAGKRRPCCFNSTVCTEPYVSHNWVLLEPPTS